MEANWWETESSNLYRPLITFLPPNATFSQPQPLPDPQPFLQTNTINPDLVNINNLTPPTNPNPNFLIEEEDRQENIELKDRSVGSRSTNSRYKPRGTKNKAKAAPVVVETESPNALQSLVLEIQEGCDINGILTTYACKNHCGVVVLSSSGSVKDVAIRNLVSPEGFIVLSGNHQILSLYGSFFPTQSPPVATGVTLFVAGEFGQVLGGITLGRLIASGPVKIVVATFNNTTCLRLPNNTPRKTSVAASAASSSGGTQGPLNPQGFSVVAPQPSPPSFY